MAPSATNGDHSSAAPRFSKDTPNAVVPLWINGKQVTTSNVLPVDSPLTGKQLYKTSVAGADECKAAIEAATNALESWRSTKPAVRRDIILKAADILEHQLQDECFQHSAEETGAPRSHFDFDFSTAVEAMRSVAGLIPAAAQGTVPSSLVEANGRAMLLQEPYGVVFAIAPWNAPHVLGIRAMLGPVAMGNTVILKGPELSPATYWNFSRAFHDAGLPAGVLNTLFLPPSDAPRLVRDLIAHPAVKKVNYTGSTAVGAAVAEAAGKHLKPVLMELGGKAPAIVCDDADLDTAAFWTALGAFMYAGQICMSTEHILVHKKVLEPFKKKLAEQIDKLWNDASKPDLHVIVPSAAEKNRALVRDAVSKGATTLLGSADDVRQLATAMRPIVVEGTAEGMQLYRTESFGPTTSLIAVADDDEAVRIANDTEYGLSSAVFTEDLRRGFRLARRIETGAVHINSMTVHDEPVLPHGGAKASGWGRFNGLDGLREWTRMKTVTWVE